MRVQGAWTLYEACTIQAYVLRMCPEGISFRAGRNIRVKSVQSALSDLLTTSATHGTFSRPSMKRGLISTIKLMQFTIVLFF